MRYHLLSIISTVLITRVLMWQMWDTQFMNQARLDVWHHVYTGVLIVLLSFGIKKYMPKLFPIISGVGVGLVLDEVTVPLCWIGYPVEYWGWVSISTAIIATFLYGLLSTRRYVLQTV